MHRPTGIRAIAPSPGAGPGIGRLPIRALTVAGSPRLAGPDDEHVRVLLATEATLPPVLVQRGTNRVVDGLHRVRAAQLRGDTSIEVVYFDGDDHDAFVAAVRANAEHGLPLSLADRKAAAARILQGRPEWSDRSVAAIVGLSPKTVGALRRTSACGPAAIRIGRDGRGRPVDPASARARVREMLAVNPAASLRTVSADAGVSVATVRSVRDRDQDEPDGTSRRPPPGAPQESTGPGVPPPAAPPPQKAQPMPSSARDPGIVTLPVGGRPPSRAPGELLRELRDDPSLRFSETGRMLLRLLAPAALDDDLLERLVGSVPQHDIELVSELGAICLQLWQDVVARLDRRRAASE